MRKRDYLALFVTALFINLLVFWLQRVPSYMDAAYYYANGIQISTGKGLTEPFIWNYLDDPSGLPHPSHIYWMPLASFLSAIGMYLSGNTDFSTARIAFVLLSSFLPPLTAYLASSMKSPIVNNERIKANAWLAGFLALFPGFYAIFTNTTDSFTIYMILGSAFLIISQVEWRKTFWRFFLLGFIAGLLHFARADGILWLFAALIIGLVYVLRKRYSGLCFYNWLLLFAIGIGYVLVMSPWYIRNVNLFGSLFPPGGSRTLWLLNYDQIFSYPATGLNFTNWWNAGLAFHLNVWLGAFWTNFKTIVGVQGLVFLLPLMILGIWHLRKEARIKTGMVMWALILGAMTFAFPFPGSRGGYLHSSAAIQPVLWAVTGFGLDVLIHAGVRWRNWAFADARKVFGIGVIFICMLVTGLLFYVRQIGPDTNHPLNRQSWDNYREVERELNTLGIEPQQAVLINNPPMYYVTNRRPAFVIPDGDIDTLVLVAKRYHLNWMVLEKDHPKGLNELYQQPDQHNRYLDYMGNEGDNEFFFIRN